MFFNWKKKLALLMAATLMAAAMTACGSGAGTGSTPAEQPAQSAQGESTTDDGELDLSQEVELVMYITGDRPAGQDVVDENLNKLLKEKLNCTIKLNWISWGEVTTKYPLLFSSGEQIDICYAGNWLNYSVLAAKGAFMPLDDLWEKYAPKNFAAQSDLAKQRATLNGHYYCVPELFSEYSSMVAIYRQDVVEGTAFEGRTIETWDDIGDYCAAVKEAHPEIEPLDMMATLNDFLTLWMQSKGYDNAISQCLAISSTKEGMPVEVTCNLPDIEEFVSSMADWAQKGYMSANAQSDTDTNKFNNGKAALNVSMLDDYQTYAVDHPDWNITCTDIGTPMAHMPTTSHSMVIPANSRYPERAMALWDLITSDQEVYDAFYYGVLGTTYELNDEGEYRILDTDLYSTNNFWAARTDGMYRMPEGTPEHFYDMEADWETRIDPNREVYVGFTFDPSNVETEIANCQYAWTQYWTPMEYGSVDYVKGLEDTRNALESAGIQKVLDEYRTQLAAFLEENGM